MAVDLCSDGLGSWAGAAAVAAFIGSPRLSFSRDLPAGESDGDTADSVERTDAALLLPVGSSEFDFGFCGASPCSSAGGAAAADELFADGMLLPIPIQPRKKKQNDVGAVVVVPGSAESTASSSSATPPSPPPRETLKEIMAAPNPDDVDTDARKPARHSFWRFSRSCSVSGGDTATASRSGSSRWRYGAGLFFSLPPLLRRSKSAGSVPSQQAATEAAAAARSSHHHSRRRAAPKNGTNPAPTPRRKSSSAAAAPRPPLSSSSFCSSSSSSSSSSSTTAATCSISSSSYYYGPCHPGAASGGMRISPVINVPPACVHRGSGGSGFFGISHLFLCSGGKKSVITADQ